MTVQEGSYLFPDEIRATAVPMGRPAGGLYRRCGKRALDVALVLLAAPFALPVVAAAWLLTRLGGAPGFYRQERIGRGGRRFHCWKIRTMAPDADQRLRRHLQANPAAAREWRERQKLRRDPRITRLGRLLRRTSLDELPQLWNVLKGDMSLVGPRPFTPEQQPLYDAEPGSDAYYRLRPGLSGLWQVEARNGSTFAARAGFDARYAARLSLGQDLAILARTVLVVLRATGN